AGRGKAAGAYTQGPCGAPSHQIGGEIPHSGENCGKIETWREGGKARLSKSKSNRLSKRSLKRLPKDRRRSSRAGKGSWKGFGFRAPVLCVNSKQPRTRAIENS